jgi:hypothetical protein
MAKTPLIHMIPSQEAKLVGKGAVVVGEQQHPQQPHRDLYHFQSSTSTLGEKGLDVSRSATIVSATSNSTVYSTTTISTENTIHRVDAVEHPLDSNVQIAIEKIDCIDDLESIEISPPSSPDDYDNMAEAPGSSVETKSTEATVAVDGSSMSTHVPSLGVSQAKRRYHGIFGLSLASIRGNKARNSLKPIAEEKPSIGKKISVHDYAAKVNGIELLVEDGTGEETSICTGTASFQSFGTRESLASKPLVQSYISMQQQQSLPKPLITAISVSQADGEVFETVSGDVSASQLVSPTEAMSRRTSSKLSTTKDAGQGMQVSLAPSKELVDAVTLATTKRVATLSVVKSQGSTSSHRNSTNETDDAPDVEMYHAYESEMLDILKTAGSYSSVGAHEEGAVVMPEISNKPQRVGINVIDTAVELRRLSTLNKETSKDDMPSKEFSKVNIKSLEDTFELVRDKSFGRLAWHDETESVHSSAVSIPNTIDALEPVILQVNSHEESVEILRSQSKLSQICNTKELIVAPLDDIVTTLKNPVRVSFQDQDEIELLCEGSTICPVALVEELPNGMAIDAPTAESVVEVGGPESSSSLFSRNAALKCKDNDANEVNIKNWKNAMTTSKRSLNAALICSDTNLYQSMNFQGMAPIDERKTDTEGLLVTKTAAASSGKDEGVLVNSKSVWENRTASLESRGSRQLSVDTPESAFFQEETPKPLNMLAPFSKSNTFARCEQPQSIPKLAAPKNDTMSVHAVGAMLEQNLKSSSKKKEEIQESRSASSEKFTSSPHTDTIKVITSSQKGIEVAPSEEFQDPFLCTPEHMVHINVLGVAGIVVDRAACKLATGDKHSPATPEKMKVVVGITEQGGVKVGAVTSLSKALICSPNGKVGKAKYRHVAVWASNNDGMTPGSLVSSDLVTMERVDPDNPQSRYKPKFFDLTIAIVDESNKQVAIPIGVAKVKVLGDMVNHGEMVSMDLPVYTLQQSKEMNSLAGQQCIKLKPKDSMKTTVKSLFHRHSSQNDEYFLTEEEKTALATAYTIDQTGDSMIRIQVRVETLGVSKDEDDLKSFRYEGGKKFDKEDSCNDTAATDPIDNDSTISSQELQSAEKTNSDTAATLETTMNDDLDGSNKIAAYSYPVDTSTEFIGSSPKPRDESNNTASADHEPRFCIPLPACGAVHDPTKAAQKLDDEIEQVADKLFGQTVPFSKTNGKGINKTQQSSDGGSIYTSLSETGDKIPLDGSVLGSTPSAQEIKSFIQEQFGICALKSGEFFFPEDPALNNDDSSSIGSATLEAFITGQLRMRTMDSTTWRKNPHGGDDDSRTYNTSASYESEPTISLRPFGESTNDQKEDPVMTTTEEGKLLDPPASNDYNGEEQRREIAFNSRKAIPVETVNEEDENETLEYDDDGDDEMSFQSLPRSKRSTGSARFDDASLPHARSVAESMVDSLAAALGLHSTCGGIVAAACGDPMEMRNRHPMKVPETLEPDVMSVGDLTATTLEHYHRHMEVAKKAVVNGKTTLKNGVNSSNPTAIMQSLFACGGVNAADNVDDDNIAVRSTPIQFSTSADMDMGQSDNVVLSNNDDGEDRGMDEKVDTDTGRLENYFSEYENSDMLQPGGRQAPVSIAVMAETRADPPKDPVGTRLTDDERSVLARSRSKKMESQQQSPQEMTKPEITKFGELEWEVDNFDEC